jgi:hypothetical protein
MKKLMSISEPFNEIFLVENFISQADRVSLLDFATTSSEDDWSIRYKKDRYTEASLNNPEKSKGFDLEVESRNKFWDDKILEIPEIYKDCTNDLWNKLNLFFKGKYKLPEITTIQRQYSGSDLSVHNDNGYKKNLQRAIVIYLNDDYSGGELFFPDHKLNFKPDAGSMITFPGTDEYMHGVTEVKDGPTRYVISVFAYTK